MTTQNFLEIKNPEEWQALFDKALFKTFFHEPRWENFLESQFKWLKFRHYLWQGQLLLSLAEVTPHHFFGRKSGGGLISHPFCEYGGPLPLKTGIDLTQFKQDLFNEFQGRKVKISFHPAIFSLLSSSLFPPSSSPSFPFSPFSPFSPSSPSSPSRPLFPSSPCFLPSIAVSARCTFFIGNLQQKTERELRSSFRKSIQQEIEKGKKNNLTIAKCENQKELRDFYQLYLAKAREHKVPAYPFSFFEYFFNNPQAEIVLAKSGNKVIAGSVFLFYAQYIHYFLNASSREGAEKRANHLILWEQIKKYCGQGKIFDLGGTRVGSSLEIFKAGWGAEKTPILEIKNYSEGKDSKYGFSRKIWGLLPIAAIRILSPRLLKYKL